jgi:hypothetical protein
MFVVSLFSRNSEACTHAAEERGRQMNRHFQRYTTRSSAGIPSESRLTGDGIEHAIALVIGPADGRRLGSSRSLYMLNSFR